MPKNILYISFHNEFNEILLQILYIDPAGLS